MNPNLNITHELTWEERSGFAGILVTFKINGDKMSPLYLATVSTMARPTEPGYARFERGRGILKDLFDGVLTWEEYKGFLQTPLPAPARLDADRTAKPLTKIVHHPIGGDNACQGPGIPLRLPELEDSDGNRTPIS